MASKGKVLLAMSGGVDSSVGAGLLLREGYDVVGVFMRLGTPDEAEALAPAGACEARPGPQKRAKGCCSVGDAADARAVAAELGIPLYVANFRRDFGRIMDYFVDEYAAGRTPNPCVRCNDWLKFGKLHDYARQLGCDFVASGHYARMTQGTKGPELRRGVDHDKDQSYVLFGVGRAQMGRMLLPIGAMRKADVRALAQELSLPVFDKPDSQEICFVPDDDYAGFVERRRPDLVKEGEIVDTAGNPLGAHAGQHKFTIGQRRGLGVARGVPLYVINRDVATNTVTVGGRDDLQCARLEVGEVNWHRGSPDDGETFEALVQWRAHGVAAAASVTWFSDVDSAAPSFAVRFDEPQEAIAPGQACVVYDRDEADLVLGGGWIVSAERA
ncbi:MAG: tRNA 2-thiouridine(34) synthase MnmA [Phycisphaerales bacterium]|nr:tRNA 2-thiouridine(34) synthase MnmA [Phycisphaerales bacterium]